MTMYDRSVPALRQTLGALLDILDKASAHCEAGKLAPEALLRARLYPDMFAFNEQIAAAIGHALGGVARLQGESVGRPTGAAPDGFPALRRALTDAIAALGAVPPESLAGAETREVSFEVPGMMLRFTGAGYLASNLLPNFYFHATIAYAIVRHLGVAVGKRDFLGRMQLAQ